ncbi:alpha/beta fold hydrolase [Castellaniella ginsengisoli]|jgi:pimeloyl-ACP methyl ester carboxylesterase|uniref:Alpha/beta fold hydrolase n=1 Tax=Castellaniella ginsengisoli TaxID=546114 RepID=A0AB39CUX2_9BURK
MSFYPVSARLRLGVLRTGLVLGARLAPRYTADWAARLFATPSPSARTMPEDGTARQGRLEVLGETVATYVWGDPGAQPYVLLAHGWSSHGLCFRPWVDALCARGYAVVTFDQPGHGRSTGVYCSLPEFVATIRAVGAAYGQAALAVGHSLGGAALVLAQDEHWQARRMVLVAPAADLPGAVGRHLRRLWLGESLRPAFYDGLLRRTGQKIEALDIHRRLPALGQPALIVHDLDDKEIPWSEGEHYAHCWPGARLLTTQGLGHRRLLDDPETVAAALAFADGRIVGSRVLGSPNLPLGFA